MPGFNSLFHSSARAAINKIPQTWRLKQLKFIFLKFWKVEAEIKVAPSWVFPEASVFVLQMARPFLWARVDSERVCSGVSSSSHEDFSQMGLGSHSNGLIYLIGSLKILSPNTVTF